ncbi:MAG TPA: hypothetical protein VF718_04415 [Allosphingosinicella sp.]|jgi:hypothetical protein
MRSKLISALAATALMAAVPSVAVAQDDDDNGISTAAVLGVVFVLVAGVILFWDGDGDPISP